MNTQIFKKLWEYFRNFFQNLLGTKRFDKENSNQLPDNASNEVDRDFYNQPKTNDNKIKDTICETITELSREKHSEILPDGEKKDSCRHRAEKDQEIKEIEQKENIELQEEVSDDGEKFVNYEGLKENKKEGLNVGKRIDISEEENNMFEYVGQIKYKTKFKFDEIYEEPLLYAYEMWIVPATEVLKYLSDVKSTQGICENFLLTELKKMIKINSEIEILTNTSLPIKKRTYGYKPDICVVYKKYNLYIDVEIDEPYDIISRKPIHYISCKSDILRNFYFTENGWVVFRFSKYQVYKYADLCRNFIAKQIDEITETDTLKSFYENADDLPFFPRWTYDTALKLAEEKEREKYLGIDSDEYIQKYSKKVFTGIKTGTDILSNTLSTKYDELKNIVNRAKFIKLIFTNSEQKLLKKSKIKKVLYNYYLHGLNVITQEIINFDIRKIEHIENLQTPFITDEIIGYENIVEKLTDTIKKWGYAKINYTNSAGENSIRNIYMIFPLWLNDLSYHIIFLHALNHLPLTDYISAHCFLRREKRTFRIDRINKLQIFNVDDSYLIESYKSHHISVGYDELLQHNLENAKNRFELLTKLYPNDLIILGNLAHSLLLSGLEKDAHKIYNEHREEMITDNISWKLMIKEDFEKFKHSGYDILLLDNCIENLKNEKKCQPITISLA